MQSICIVVSEEDDDADDDDDDDAKVEYNGKFTSTLFSTLISIRAFGLGSFFPFFFLLQWSEDSPLSFFISFLSFFLLCYFFLINLF